VDTGLDVLVVADGNDPQARVVLDQLGGGSTGIARLNLGDIRAVRQSAQPGALDLDLGGSWRRISDTTTVWWHRAGVVDVAALDAEEAALARDEGPHVLRGALAGSWCRWVDDPFDVGRAELKLAQLAAATSLGVRIPDSRVTNDPFLARQFAAGRRVIAKALSPGVGIAPYTAELGDADLDVIGGLPALIQELIQATADVRVVVVGGRAWAWERQRGGNTVDWRAEAPDGAGFVQVEAPHICEAAVRVTSALRLTTSVQDWLETADAPVFLEANPQGRWLFLPGADEIVAPALADHLRQTRQDRPGTWPRAIQRVASDFRRKAKAPPADGVVAPAFAKPPWIDEVASRPGSVDVARRAHDDAAEGAKTAEEKANRLVQVALALLTVTLALGTFQLKFALDRSWVWLWSALPVALALTFLALAAFEALQVDRVGMYIRPKPADLVDLGSRSPEAIVLAREEEGRRLAQWTSDNKHDDLMQARAWFTRGLAAVLCASLLAATLRASASTSRPSTTPIKVDTGEPAGR
jgi:glutathione synthase/RimK-type ligase-like ATP-grasp enzyme